MALCLRGSIEIFKLRHYRNIELMKTQNNIFTGRKLLIATKQKKEKVITPLLEKALGVICFINTDFNSDIFGTFTGEIDAAMTQ